MREYLSCVPGDRAPPRYQLCARPPSAIGRQRNVSTRRLPRGGQADSRDTELSWTSKTVRPATEFGSTLVADRAPARTRYNRKAAVCGAFVARPERFELPTFGSVAHFRRALSRGRGPQNAVDAGDGQMAGATPPASNRRFTEATQRPARERTAPPRSVGRAQASDPLNRRFI
jgi:hypothetical protein